MTTRMQAPTSVQDILHQFDDVGLEQAFSGVQSLPVQMAYEAKNALTQLRDGVTGDEVVEPLARAIGWAEALTFAFSNIGTNIAPPTVGNGYRQPVRSS
jgi:hypothetical protein